MRLSLSLIALLLVLFAGSAPAQQKVTVAVAANMQPAMEQLKPDFEKETGITVELIMGSSGKLSTQITEGAPFDVFVSADMKFPGELFKKGLATAEPEVYATGQLVLWTSDVDCYRICSPYNSTPAGNLGMLVNEQVKKIAIANPQTAPYGAAAVEAMNYYKMYDKLKDKLVYGESIGQTREFVATKAASVGFIARSQVQANHQARDGGMWVAIPQKAYSPIRQGAVILKHGKETNDAASLKFYKFLYSTKARSVFKELGYVVD